MFKKALLAAAAIAAIGAAPAQAQTAPAPAAEPAPAYTFTGNITLASDYRFRGISQTNKKPALQGGFDFAHSSGFYLGNWNSNIDANFFAGSNLEMDFYGGFKNTIGDFGYDIGYLYYYYPGSDPTIKNGELYVAGSFGPVSLKYSHPVTDFFGWPDSKGSYYLDLSATVPLGAGFSLVAHAGYQKLKGDARVTEIDGSGPQDSIVDYKIGATYDLSGWILGLAFVGTNRDLYGAVQPNGSQKNVSNNALVASLAKSF